MKPWDVEDNYVTLALCFYKTVTNYKEVLAPEVAFPGVQRSEGQFISSPRSIALSSNKESSVVFECHASNRRPFYLNREYHLLTGVYRFSTV